MTTANIIFHCWQNCKKSFEEQTKEKFIPGEKKLFYFFQDFEWSYFLLLAKKSCHCCQNSNLRIFARFWGKTFFSESEHDFNLLRTLRWKKWVFYSRVFFGVQPTKIRASREKFCWKKISVSKKFSFSVIIFGVSVISLSFCKVVQSGVSNYRSTCGKKKIGEINPENLFF